MLIVGLGLQLNNAEFRVGEFGASTKSKRTKSAGRSLAAISILSESMEIISASSCGSQAYKKVFTQVSSQVLCVEDCLEIIGKHGTSVSVSGLFYKLIVRRQSTIMEKELTLVKEFIQNMSIIHHNIHWTLRDSRSGTCLLQLASSPSVMQRLITCHGMGFVTKLCQVSSEGTKKMNIVGLISEPTSSSCCWNKDYQYLFINERWIKGSTLVQQLLDKVFGKLLLGRTSFGMTSKHRNLQSDTSLRYPAFVLQLICPDNMVDILPESDEQQLIVFRDISALQSLLEQLLRQLCPYNTNLESAINEVFSSLNGNSNFNTKSFLSPSAAKLSFASPTMDNASLERQQFILQQRQNTQRTIAIDMFDSAFQLSDPHRLSLTPSTVPAESPLLREGLSVRVSRPSPLQPFERQFPHISKDERDCERIQERKRSRDESENVDWLRDIFDTSEKKKQQLQQPTNANEMKHIAAPISRLHGESSRNEDLSRARLFLSTNDESLSTPRNAQSQRVVKPAIQLSNPLLAETQKVETEAVEEAVVFDYEEAGVIRHSLHQPQSENANNEPQPKRSRPLDHLIKFKSAFAMQTKKMSVQKDAIHGMQVIGQVDKKYIAVVHHDEATTESTIMLFDQHAVDERLRYEKLYDIYRSESKRHTVLLPRPVSIPIDFVMLNTLQQRESLFKWWCFDYYLQYDHESGLSQPTAVLLAVPCVYENEVLTEDDFLEFCHDIQMHHELPDHLHQPPSFLRIAASKACRSAIKFGQVLHMQEMQQMIHDLQSMKMPFQCAHGRPSCVPMLEMGELQRRCEREEEIASFKGDGNNLNRFWEIYRGLDR